MNLTSRPAARVLGRSFGRNSAACLTLVLAAGASACSQRDEWRNHYLELAPGPKPKPTPKPVDPTSAPDAAASSAETSSSTAGQAVSDAGAITSGAHNDAGFDSVAVRDAAASSTEVVPVDAAPDAQPPLVDGAPSVNAELADLSLDVFGSFDNRYWFVVSDEQVNTMNQGRYGYYGPVGMYGDIYNPGGGSAGKTYADHLLVTNAKGTADVGKVQATLVGGSTYRPWTESTLPNIKIDSNEFQDKVRLGGYEHLRFNNAIVGSIFREKFAYDFYRALGYPAPKAGYGWVSSTVWSPDVAVPYIVVESYKRQFCRDRSDYFGDECPNMWEFASDITWAEMFNQPDVCQYSDCDSTVVTEMANLVAQTAEGPGFKDATASYIDWDSFHEFQCLSWLFGTWDDYVHGGNNSVLVERPDGKFQFLPYSVDISFNHDWGSAPPLPGYTALPRGCQSDPDCWADTIATCEVLVDAYKASGPVARLDALYADLDAAGMLRQGDEGRYEQMRSGIQTQISGLDDELSYWRDNPNPDGNYYGGCAFPLVECGGSCVFIDDCPVCDDEPMPVPVPLPGDWLLLQSVDGGASDAGALGSGPLTSSSTGVGASDSEGSVSTGPAATSALTELLSSSVDAAVPAGTDVVVSEAVTSAAIAIDAGAAAPVDAAVLPTSPVEAGAAPVTSEDEATWGQGTSGQDTTGTRPCRPRIDYYFAH